MAVKKSEDEHRFRMVLCDGMGHGIKANILSNMTCDLVMDFDFKQENLSCLTQTILAIQPVCSLRNMNHCTYTVVDIDTLKGCVSVVNYDNPEPVFFIGNTLFEPQWSTKTVEEYDPRPQKVSFADLSVNQDVSIVIFSDGVTQSGMGKRYSFGWEYKNCVKHLQTIISNPPNCIATDLVMTSIENDGGLTFDDVSCAVIKITKIDKQKN